MSKAKKIVLAIASAILAISMCLVYALDGDPNTVPDVKGTIEKVKESVEVIKDAKAEEAEAEIQPVEVGTQ